jgi:hypothetical protein
MELSGNILEYDLTIETKINNIKGACFYDGYMREYDDRVEIPYKPSNRKLLMSLVAGAILCGYRHIELLAGLVIIYFDDTIELRF